MSMKKIVRKAKVEDSMMDLLDKNLGTSGKYTAEQLDLLNGSALSNFTSPYPIVAAYVSHINEQTADFYCNRIRELDGERDATNDSRIQKHKNSMKSNSFFPTGSITLAYVESEKALYKVDGNGRSFSYLQYLQEGGNANFPITYHVYKVKHRQDLIDLYNSYDLRVSSRTKKHQRNVVNLNSGIPFLKENAPRRIMSAYHEALDFMHMHYLYYPDKGEALSDPEKAKLSTEYADLLETVDPLIDRALNKAIWHLPPVLAVMLYTFHISGEDKTKAHIFWGKVTNFTQTNNEQDKDPIAAMIMKLHHKCTDYDAHKISPIPKKDGVPPSPAICGRALASFATVCWNNFLNGTSVKNLKYNRNSDLPLPMDPNA